MDFEIVGDLTNVETIAAGRGIRALARLRRLSGSASPNCTGMKRTASAKKSSSKKGTSTRSRRAVASERRFAVCIRNQGYEASLERNKIYEILPDEEAARDGDLRVVDESGEDYLFSADRFVAIEVPAAVRDSLSKATRA